MSKVWWRIWSWSRWWRAWWAARGGYDDCRQRWQYTVGRYHQQCHPNRTVTPGEMRHHLLLLLSGCKAPLPVVSFILRCIVPSSPFTLFDCSTKPGGPVGYEPCYMPPLLLLLLLLRNRLCLDSFFYCFFLLIAAGYNHSSIFISHKRPDISHSMD